MFGSLDDLFKYIQNCVGLPERDRTRLLCRLTHPVGEFAVPMRRISFHADAERGALCPGQRSQRAPLPFQQYSSLKKIKNKIQ